MLYPAKYKDRNAFAVETDALTMLVLPDDGAKIASLKRKIDGKELLVTKQADKYKALTCDGSYVDSECSGFDDMFPTVDPETVAGIPYPDHGECCRLSYTAAIEGAALLLRAESRLFPVTYEKRIFADGADSICIEYGIENRGKTAFPFLWAGHIMLAGEAGMRVLTPFAEDTPVEMMFVDPPSDDQEQFPRDRLISYRPGSGVAYKFYYLDRMPEGSFGVSYPDGWKLQFTVDPQKLPYLGIWLNNGCFQDGYSITPEPCTIPFDATGRAAERGHSGQIPPDETFSFSIQIQLKEA